MKMVSRFRGWLSCLKGGFIYGCSGESVVWRGKRAMYGCSLMAAKYMESSRVWRFLQV